VRKIVADTVSLIYGLNKFPGNYLPVPNSMLSKRASNEALFFTAYQLP